MRTIARYARSLFAVGAGAMLVACGGAQEPVVSGENAAPALNLSSPAIASRLSGPLVAARGAQPERPARHASWIAYDVKQRNTLLFVSDFYGDAIDIFSLPTLQVQGQITGLFEPQGECSDNAGNVWVANSGSAQMIEYSHTGTLLKTLSDSSGYPVGCAVDPRNGNLAVFNLYGTKREGAIWVYKGASGVPKRQTVATFYYYYFGDYDNKGDLFVDGRNASGVFAFGKVPRGSSRGKPLTIGGGTIYFPGSVQWDSRAKQVDIVDQDCSLGGRSCLYAVSVSGFSGSITGSTFLKDQSGNPVCDTVQAVIVGQKKQYAVAGDYATGCGSAQNAVGRWQYPMGGEPLNFNDSAQLESPIGAAVSRQ